MNLPNPNQADLHEAAITHGYLATIDELVFDPVTGEPEATTATLAVREEGRVTFVASWGNEWSFDGWDDTLTITHLWPNPECVGCGEATNSRDFVRCKPCTLTDRQAVAS